jgi:hypothetical protein
MGLRPVKIESADGMVYEGTESLAVLKTYTECREIGL